MVDIYTPTREAGRQPCASKFRKGPPTRNSSRSATTSDRRPSFLNPSIRPSRSSTISSSKSGRGSSGDHEAIQPSFFGYVETVLDALLLVEAFRRGSIQGLRGRIPASQRENLVQSGSTFIFLESDTDILRWTDGKKWTPSRVGGEYLVYREPTNEVPSIVFDAAEDSDLARRMRSLVVSLTDGSRTEKGYVDPQGLAKRTIVLTSEGRLKYHIISYYHPQDALEGHLKTPSEIPWLMILKDEISQDLLNPRLFKRNPPRVSRDPVTNLLRYEGEDVIEPPTAVIPLSVQNNTRRAQASLIASFDAAIMEYDLAYDGSSSPSARSDGLTVVDIATPQHSISTGPLLPAPSYPFPINNFDTPHFCMGGSSELSDDSASQTEDLFSLGLTTTGLQPVLVTDPSAWFLPAVDGPLMPVQLMPLSIPVPFLYPPFHGNGTISPALLTPTSDGELDSYFTPFGTGTEALNSPSSNSIPM